MRHIHKQFPGVRALENVSFDLRPGEVHCLVGENGAGKSTLIKILAGALRQDQGSILLAGRELTEHSPAQAHRLGIGIIYQDFKLVPELSVAENILLGREPVRFFSFWVDFKKMRAQAVALLAQIGEKIEVRARVATLSVAQRQIVEIAKALSQHARILVLDEPTAALTGTETKNLFTLLHKLKAEGAGIIYISHRLEEIFEIGDRLTVLRDGQVVHTGEVRAADRRRLIHWMVGRELENEYPRIELQRGPALLRVENLSNQHLHGITFTLHQGEILGLAGLVGAGRTELARAIFGADAVQQGKIFLAEKEIHPASPRAAIALGLGLLTEDRNRYGLIMAMSVRENISLANLRAVCRGAFIQKKEERNIAGHYAGELRIKTPSTEQKVETLSGGNRQKVVLARWLFTKSKVLIFDEPTAGIDAGAKYEIYQLINQLAQNGIGVMIISSDLPELLGICSRIAVMRAGRMAGILTRAEFSQERIMALATGTAEGV